MKFGLCSLRPRPADYHGMRKMPPQNRATRFCASFSVALVFFCLGEGGWGGLIPSLPHRILTERKLEVFSGSKGANSRLAAVIELPPHRFADAMGSISNALWQMRHVCCESFAVPACALTALQAFSLPPQATSQQDVAGLWPTFAPQASACGHAAGSGHICMVWEP